MTLDIYPVTEDPLYFTTMAGGFSHDGIDRTDDLRSTTEIKQTINSQVNRVTTILQNVDKIIGGSITDESLVKAVAVVGRFFRDENGVLDDVWEELFRGQLVPGDLTEEGSQIEILSDLVAAGYCVAADTLAENCQLPYKGDRCGYAGAVATCNKKRKSPDGCSGKTDAGDDETHEYAFGGMEFPDVQAPTSPSGGGGGGGHIHCPRVDQWLPALGANGEILPKRAGAIKARKDWLYNPLTGVFERVKKATIIRDQPIWCVTSAKGVQGYSSFTHPIFPYRSHATGVRASEVKDGDALLLLRLADRGLIDHSVSKSFNTRELGDVVWIELESGFVYAYGSRPDLYIVCHNAKLPILD